MLKIKLFAIFGILGFVTTFSNLSSVFVSKAENETVLQEINKYKTWSKINEKPIRVELNNLEFSGG